MREKRHLILIRSQRKADKIRESAGVYFAKVDVWYDKRSQLFMAEIICRDSEWCLLKKALPTLRKEGIVYGVQ